jgi:hypothetical protein
VALVIGRLGSSAAGSAGIESLMQMSDYDPLAASGSRGNQDRA